MPKFDTVKTNGSLRIGFNRALSLLRPACHALVAPRAVVLDAGGRARPLVRQRRQPSGNLAAQFESAVSDLLQLIDDSGSHGRRLHLVVSEFWARPVVLQLPGQAPSDDEIDIVLQSHYRRTYADLMGGWHWCWDRQGTQLLAVAWPTAGLAALRAGLAKRSGTLVTAKPLAIDLVAQAPMECRSAWLAIIEQQSFTLVRQQNGIWQGWCSSPVGTDSDLTQSLSLQLVRESARRADDCRVLTLIDLTGAAPINLIRKTLADAGWSPRVWSPSQSDASLACRLSQAMASGVPA